MMGNPPQTDQLMVELLAAIGAPSKLDNAVQWCWSTSRVKHNVGGAVMMAAGATTTAADDDDENEIDLDSGEAAADILDEDAIDLEDALEDEQAVESQQGGSPRSKPPTIIVSCHCPWRHARRRCRWMSFNTWLSNGRNQSRPPARMEPYHCILMLQRGATGSHSILGCTMVGIGQNRRELWTPTIAYGMHGQQDGVIGSRSMLGPAMAGISPTWKQGGKNTFGRCGSSV
jgi:hypothetical protein